MTTGPLIELREVRKNFGRVTALRGVSLEAWPGEVLCLLGDNGAGKSTLIKILSGVHQPSGGTIVLEAKEVTFPSPRAAKGYGIAAVHQEVGIIPLMSVARNFVLGAEPLIGRGLFRRMDLSDAGRIALEQLHAIGIRHVTDPAQLGGTLSGGERQALAIARAVHFGARVLILDEPTSSLGVREARTVLKMVERARAGGVAVILITHNAHHALTVGDRFVVLLHGRVAESFQRGERTAEDVVRLMAGGEELEELEQAAPFGVSDA
jgi:simple sugar transport system ATP-binding protein